jgi:pimeloyl-ACP methyl ester carboxylesterase
MITCHAATGAIRLVPAVSLLCIMTAGADARPLIAQDAGGARRANVGHSPPGRLIDIGGYRLHLNCAGSGSPTIVLAAGAGDYSVDWALVQPRMATETRVCSYDRAGEAWSDPGPMPRTMAQEAYELQALLDRGGERAPYVLVGHSFAGLTMRIFAQRYPADVAGVVLVDATSEDAVLNVRGKLTRLRLEAKQRPIPEPQSLVASPPTPTSEADMKEFLNFQRQFGATNISPPFDRLPVTEQAMDLWARNEPPRVKDGEDYSPEEMAALHDSAQRRPTPLGDTPLYVLIAGRQDRKPPNIADTVWTKLMKEKLEQKRRFGELSRRSVVRVIEESGHHIQLEKPMTVVDAVRWVIAQWRSGPR